MLQIRGNETLARDELVGLDVLVRGRLDDVGRQLRRLARAVPIGIEPITHELLVEACLALSRLIGILRPEARGIRREHLIGQGERAIDRAEFELGIGDDDAMLAA